MKTGGHDAKRTKFHMNVAINYIEFVPVKQKYARVILCLMTSLHVKKQLKNVQKCRERGRVNAKRAVEKQSKEFIEKESCDFE